MDIIFTANDIKQRIAALHSALTVANTAWDTALIFGRVSQYYYTGTMQEGVLALKKDGSYAYFVRKSFLRAQAESKLDHLIPMVSYRDMLDFLGENLGQLYVDKDVATLTVLDRIQKHFQIDHIFPIEPISGMVRAVKSEKELALMQESGRRHKRLLEEVLPGLLAEGITEAELMGNMYREMLKLGFHGVSRFAMFQTELVTGQLAFGENSVYPTSFDGPGGMKGGSAAAPNIGDRNRRLKKGDLVFADIGYGYEGYHSDRTQVYCFGAVPTQEMAESHRRCLEIEQKAAAMLKPGAIPSEVYRETVACQDDIFLTNFMGVGQERVRFLGHGVGLHIDELPVLAPGFCTPLQKNMVIALEPKKSLPGLGTVGVEDTYIVTENGGVCITGGEKEIIVVAN